MRSWIAVAAICCIGWVCAAEEFGMIAVEKGGTIRCGVLPDHVYTVESRDDPTAPWEAVAPADQWPINAPEWLVNGGAGWPAVAQRFYRAMAEPASSGPDMYLVLDLSDGPSASIYPVSYMSAVPVGGWTDEYKTTKMVLRRIPAGTFTMGSPTEELGRWDNEAQRQVLLTQDFYIGVFEVTQKQWERVMGTWPSWFGNTTYRDARPVENVSYYHIRENPDNSAISPNWPQSSQVHADSFMGRLRAKTSLATLDLPTEAQWEYACRAGTTTALNSGKKLTATDTCPNLAEVGRYFFNGGSGSLPGADTSMGTAKVGSYRANAWGLYDMHSNLTEWCLDWYETHHAPTTDPAGATSGSQRVGRGGSWSVYARVCRSARRGTVTPSSRTNNRGFRVSRPVP